MFQFSLAAEPQRSDTLERFNKRLMPSADKTTLQSLERLKQASLQRLLDDAAALQRIGQLKQMSLRPGQARPSTRELRVKSPSQT